MNQKETNLRCVVIGSDHAGYGHKQELIEYLREMGYEVLAVGTTGTIPVDYPDYAEVVGTAILLARADRGVLICGSGVGGGEQATRDPRRLCHDSYSAHQGVEHDAVNVLVVGARYIGPALARELVRPFLRGRFFGEERQRRRLDKSRLWKPGMDERELLHEGGSHDPAARLTENGAIGLVRLHPS